ncbi:hypothetical protein FRC08_010202 [Ceratobasidium sp. 394]|nr:hypothetical protein FRC08_010202 [Ceratobasidium sp. 394]KAG9085096.1 hypothetical protein FS749_004699 [Ceratobasidium sp. UAMH 11750]
MPINRTRMIRYEFEYPYELNPDFTSYLDEIHIWAQHVQVHPVDWKIQAVSKNPRDGFYAFPIFPDYRGNPYSKCTGEGSSRDKAREHATQLLSRDRIDANSPLVRWRFSERNTPRGIIHCATPIIYRQNTIMQNDKNVIGYGSSHQRAKEDSARKLLELGYCRV